MRNVSYIAVEAVFQGDLTIEGNHAINNGTELISASGIGFSIWASGVTRVRRNTASGNLLWGFFVALGAARIVENSADGNRDFGFVIEGGDGPGYSVVGNRATNNGGGFSLDGANHFVGQNLVMNNFSGIDLSGVSELRLVRNAIVGNKTAGILIGLDATGPVAIHRNNLYGNGGAFSSSSELNCAITNQSGRTMDARNNFWGLPTGPGPDPADEGGMGVKCDPGIGTQTLVIPFATRPFHIPPAP